MMIYATSVQVIGVRPNVSSSNQAPSTLHLSVLKRLSGMRGAPSDYSEVCCRSSCCCCCFCCRCGLRPGCCFWCFCFFVLVVVAAGGGGGGGVVGAGAGSGAGAAVAAVAVAVVVVAVVGSGGRGGCGDYAPKPKVRKTFP